MSALTLTPATQVTQQTPAIPADSGIVHIEVRTTVAVLREEIEAAATLLSRRHPEHAARVARAAGILSTAEPGEITLDVRGSLRRPSGVTTTIHGHDVDVWDLERGEGECECPDWEHRNELPEHGGHCKHVLTVELLDLIGVLD